jgi:MbtH protein
MVEGDEAMYVVVVNDEEQYSIWREGRSVPAGWHQTEKTGTREDCLKYIDEIWSDLRPLSVRKKLQTPHLMKA